MRLGLRRRHGVSGDEVNIRATNLRPASAPERAHSRGITTQAILETLLTITLESSDAFPPLKSTIGAITSIMKLAQVRVTTILCMYAPASDHVLHRWLCTGWETEPGGFEIPGEKMRRPGNPSERMCYAAGRY